MSKYEVMWVSHERIETTAQLCLNRGRQRSVECDFSDVTTSKHACSYELCSCCQQQDIRGWVASLDHWRWCCRQQFASSQLKEAHATVHRAAVGAHLMQSLTAAAMHIIRNRVCLDSITSGAATFSSCLITIQRDVLSFQAVNLRTQSNRIGLVYCVCSTSAHHHVSCGKLYLRG